MCKREGVREDGRGIGESLQDEGIRECMLDGGV